MNEPLPTFLNAPAAWAALPLLLVGLWWIVRSWRGRAILAPPRCGRCAHPIEPRDAPRCPECGADESAFAYGRRGVSLRGVAAGCAMVLLALPLADAADQQLAGRSALERWSEPITSATPDAELWRLVATGAPQAGAASTQLTHRMRAPRAVASIADALLADPSWQGAADGRARGEAPGGLLLGTALALRGNGLDDRRWEAVTARLVPQPMIRLRARHRLGSQFELSIDGAPEAFGSTSYWVSCRGIRVNGVIVRLADGRPAQFYFGGTFQVEAPRTIGRHRIEFSWRQAIAGLGGSTRAVSMSVRAPSTAEVDWWRDGTWVGEVEVVPEGAAIFTAVDSPDRRPFAVTRDAIESIRMVELGSRTAFFLELRPWSEGARPFGTWTVLQGGEFRAQVGPMASPAAPRERARGVWTVTREPLDPSRDIVLRYDPVVAPEREPGIHDDEIWGEPFEVEIPASELVRDPRRVARTWNWRG